MRIAVLCLLLWTFTAPFASAEPVARVNRQDLSEQELQQALQEFAANRGLQTETLRRAPEFPRLRAALVNSLVERELLWQAASTGHLVGDEQVDQALARVRSQLGGPQRLERALRAQGMDQTMLRQRLQRDLTIQAYLQQQVYADVQVSKTEAEDYYRANLDRFRSPDLLHLRHILVPDTSTKAQQTARDLHRQLQQGAQFAALAREHSADVSARQGGDLGFLNAADLGPELAPAAEGLQVGEVSAPLPGPGGLHLLHLDARHPGIQASLDQVREAIRERLLETRRDEALRTHLQQLRQAANIEVLP